MDSEGPLREAMRTSWEAGESGRPRSRKWTRRDFVKIGLAAGAATAAGAAVAGSLLGTAPAPETSSPILYTRFPGAAWWNSKAGTPMNVTDFSVWEGASGAVNASLANGQAIPNTGLPVLVVRIPRDVLNFTAPPPDEFPLEQGFALYYDDASRGIRIVAAYDRCAHLCCYPGWHVITNPAPPRDYVNPCPTYQVYGQDPVYCICHGSQYDPMVLAKDVNPVNGATYVGARMVHGPAQRAIPVVALKTVDDVLHGLAPDAKWYAYC